MTKFSDLKLDPKVLKAVTEAGYETPTPIQQGAIPPALEGRDVLGIAQTGTGKTASFTLPMITLLGRGRARARMPRSLVLCPTRELAAQVAENFDTYAKHTRLTKALLIGGVSFGEQDKLIDRGVDVLIATPGRLLDHVERGKLLLTGVQIMVVDEADRMLDMGFIPDIERIFQLTPFTRQTLFFSATMAPEIERITNTFLHSPERIEVARQATASETITQRLIQLTPARRDMASKQKRDLLRALIDAEGAGLTNAIVFCNRKTEVDILAKSLAKHGYDAAPLHGDLDQTQRTRTLESFRDGKLRLLIASDVAARGLDIPAVSHVFNYDLPSHAEDYVHRIGRTGRAGRLGTAVSIATPADDKYLDAIENLLKKSLPRVDAPAGFATRETTMREDRTTDETRSEEGRGGSRDRRRRRRDDSRPEAEARSDSTADTRTATAEAAPEPLPDSRPEPARAEQSRPEQARAEQARAEQPRREESRREETRREETRRDEGRRNDRRDGRRGRDQDHRGAQVMGLGDHVPQFMLVELRTTTTSDEGSGASVRPDAEPVADAAPAAEAQAKPARRGRGRGRGKAQAGSQDEAAAVVSEAVEASPAETTAETGLETGLETGPRSGPQTGSDTGLEAATDGVAAAQDAAPEVDAPKPKRTRGRKTAAKSQAAADTVDAGGADAGAAETAAAEARAPEQAADAQAAPEQAASEKAAPKRRSRKAAAGAEEAGEAAPAAEKPKRSRRNAATAESPASEPEAAPATEASEKPKRARRKKSDAAPQPKDAEAEA